VLKELRKWNQRRKVKKTIREISDILFEMHWPKYYDAGLSKQKLQNDIASHICDVLNREVDAKYMWIVEKC